MNYHLVLAIIWYCLVVTPPQDPLWMFVVRIHGCYGRKSLKTLFKTKKWQVLCVFYLFFLFKEILETCSTSSHLWGDIFSPPYNKVALLHQSNTQTSYWTDHPEARGHTCTWHNRISRYSSTNEPLLMQSRRTRPQEKLFFFFIIFGLTLECKTVTWHKSSNKANIVPRYFPLLSDARCWMLYEMPPLYFSRWQHHSLLYGEWV